MLVATRHDDARTAQLIDDDLRTVGLQGVFALYSLSDHTWTYGAEDERGRPDADFGDEGFVGLMSTAQRLFGADDESPGLDWVDVVSFVQDCVVDELGFGWPELYENHRFVALLTPGWLDHRPVWLRSGQPFSPVGSLGRLAPGTIKHAP